MYTKPLKEQYEDAKLSKWSTEQQMRRWLTSIRRVEKIIHQYIRGDKEAPRMIRTALLPDWPPAAKELQDAMDAMKRPDDLLADSVELVKLHARVKASK